MAQINKPGLHFNTLLWTGNDATSRGITGAGFQPDWVWIKARAGGDSTQSHILNDAVRGAGKFLYSDSNDAESTDTNRLTSFNADGFTLGSNNSTNGGGTTYVSWNWKAGNSAGSSNSDGSINSTVSVNTTSGFSIVSWTGSGANATIGHGLGSTPQCIIVKNRSDADNWVVYHQGLGNTDGMYLNTSDSTVGTNTFWNNTTPTTSVFSVGTHNRVNGSSNNMIAYCFANKKGFSRFGTYEGNGNADGTFVYTGFRPAFVIQRQTNNTRDWTMIDSKRSTSNVMDDRLVPNENAAEVTNNDTDFLSNGFKNRGTQTNTNESGGSYIYFAWAENPLVGTNNVPGVAR